MRADAKPGSSFQAPPGVTLAAALRGRFPSKSWSDVRRLCATGKVTIDGRVEVDPAKRLSGGEAIELRMNAPDPAKAAPSPGFRIVHEDPHLLVIEKPEGASSVPYERKDAGTALDLIRAEWKRTGRASTATPLYTVHRLDKDTSGLLCFAKTRLAERGLHTIFQKHLAEREYVAVAQGHVASQRIESILVADRGDGIRGTPRGKRAGMPGQNAVTHVTAVEHFASATLVRVRLETGRTHQIRIHLSERGHPLVGETVYVRDLLRAGREPLPSPRLLLHAETLAFDHPVMQGERIDLRCPPPPAFQAEVERLRQEKTKPRP